MDQREDLHLVETTGGSRPVAWGWDFD
jgi:hypothetical protein